MDQGRSYNKRNLVIGLVAAVLIVIFLFSLIANSGKTAVTVEVIPNDANLTMNGKTVKPGTLRLSPGEYTVEAAKDGFETDTYTVTVGDENLEVGLIPTPVSDEALAWLNENPEIQLRREELGGQRAAQRGLAFEAETPLLTQLPHNSILPYKGEYGPFSVDYGPSREREFGIFLLISNSSPDGRRNALEWIRDQGYDPTDFEIVYDDFDNPLSEEE